jgi:NAD(P)-dependent dehydrogenase (short-subunit alcohol dehydrogenase family)
MNLKKIFVFGGSGLIGKSLIEKLNRSRLNVFNIDVKFNGTNKKNNFYLDLFDSKNLEIRLNYLIKKFGIPDSVVFASYPATKNFSKQTAKKSDLIELNKNIEFQLSNICWIANKLAKKMKSRKKRNILLISSIYGLVGQNMEVYKGTSMEENICYPIIKGGIISFTKQLASIYGKYDLRVNCLLPGAILGHVKNSKKKQPKKFIENFSKQVPLKRLANPKEIANVINFLISEESSYITGATIIADGGWTAI